MVERSKLSAAAQDPALFLGHRLLTGVSELQSALQQNIMKNVPEVENKNRKRQKKKNTFFCKTAALKVLSH